MTLNPRSNENLYGVADLLTTTKHRPVLISFKSKFLTKTIVRKERINTQGALVTGAKRLLQHFFTEVPRGYADPLKIYLHNLGRFDNTLLLEQLAEAKEKPAVLLRDNRIYFIKYKNIELLDSYLKAPYSLRTLAKMFNIPYQEDHSANLIYLQAQVKVLWLVLQQLDQFFLENFQTSVHAKLTYPSLVLHSYLTNYTEYLLNKPNEFVLNVHQQEFIRNSLRGGLSDIYIPRGTNLVHLDYNAMYTDIMGHHSFGVGPLLYQEQLTTDNLYRFTCLYKSFIEVQVEARNVAQPLLMFKHKSEVLQPLGKFKITLYSEEIKYCLEHYAAEYTFTPLRAYYYQRAEPIFREIIYAMQLLKIKYHSNALVLHYIKLMFNSLHGRLAINFNQRSRIQIADDQSIETLVDDTDTIKGLSKINNLNVLEYYGEAYPGQAAKQTNTNIGAASAITALARLKMQNLKQLVRVYYCDTDAIVTDKASLSILHKEISSKAGKLKITDYYEEALFLTTHTYIFKKNGELVTKGLQHTKVSTSSLNEPATVWSHLLRSSIQAYREEPLIENLNKLVMQANYDKRIKLYNKYSTWEDTTPYIIKGVVS
jgi:hypothetical protein